MTNCEPGYATAIWSKEIGLHNQFSRLKNGRFTHFCMANEMSGCSNHEPVYATAIWPERNEVTQPIFKTEKRPFVSFFFCENLINVGSFPITFIVIYYILIHLGMIACLFMPGALMTRSDYIIRSGRKILLRCSSTPMIQKWLRPQESQAKPSQAKPQH